MSAVTVDSRMARGVRFYGTTLGKKAVVAVTGILMFGFLIAHMAGNLQFFAGREQINHYAESLRQMPALLWGARVGLLAAAVLHIAASVQLVKLQHVARPHGYLRKQNVGSSYASRTMRWSGPIILAFLVYHLLHLTWGVTDREFVHLDAYGNLVRGFSQPVIAIAYIVAMLLLSLHLYHGLWSMFQTLGFSHPRYSAKLRLAAKLFTVLLVLGFLSVPVAILAGYRPPDGTYV